MDDGPEGCSLKVSPRRNAQPVVLEIHSADGTAVWFVRRLQQGEAIDGPASATGSGRSRSALTTAKIAVLAPMATRRHSMARSGNPGGGGTDVRHAARRERDRPARRT
jgi:hypothetical protein